VTPAMQATIYLAVQGTVHTVSCSTSSQTGRGRTDRALDGLTSGDAQCPVITKTSRVQSILFGMHKSKMALIVPHIGSSFQ
jgi:hypothetical protein